MNTLTQMATVPALATTVLLSPVFEVQSLGMAPISSARIDLALQVLGQDVNRLISHDETENPGIRFTRSRTGGR